jgi:hypothetical protein
VLDANPLADIANAQRGQFAAEGRGHPQCVIPGSDGLAAAPCGF